MIRSLIYFRLHKFTYPCKKDYSVMEYGENIWFLWFHIHIKRFIIWDIRMSKFWIWRKIRELQGEEYV